MSEPVIVARGVGVELGGVPVLEGIDLTACPGEVVAVLGANGVGKSTLLRCLAGLQRCAGRVEVLGRPPADTPGFWREVALVGDEPAWYPGLTAGEHLELMGAVHGPGRLETGAALELFGLSGCADRAPSALSTGQRQRLSLAMGLVRPSRVLLLDEPERGLDAAFRDRFAGLLVGYAAGGGAVVMVTHDAGFARNARPLVLGEAA